MDCCEDDNEPLGFMKGREFLEQLIDVFCQFCALCACVLLLSPPPSFIHFHLHSYWGFVKGHYFVWQVTSLFTESFLT